MKTNAKGSLSHLLTSEETGNSKIVIKCPGLFVCLSMPVVTISVSRGVTTHPCLHWNHWEASRSLPLELLGSEVRLNLHFQPSDTAAPVSRLETYP